MQENLLQQEPQLEPIFFVKAYKSLISTLESKFPEKSSFVIILINSILIAVIMILKSSFLNDIPSSEILFVGTLVAFLANYYLLRMADIQPYIDNEEQNFRVKYIGFVLLFSYVFLIQAFTSLDYSTCIYIFFSSWIFGILGEFFGYQVKPNSKTFCVIAFMFLGQFVQFSPKFFDILSLIQPAGDETQRDPQDLKWKIGLALAILSSMLLSHAMFNIKKLGQYDTITLTHVISFIIIMFLPVFFPIQGLISPTLEQLIIMISIGLTLVWILNSTIKAAQTEIPSKILLNLPICITVAWLINEFNPQVFIGCSLIIIANIMLFNVTNQKSQINHQIGQVKEYDFKEKGVELKELIR